MEENDSESFMDKLVSEAPEVLSTKPLYDSDSAYAVDKLDRSDSFERRHVEWEDNVYEADSSVVAFSDDFNRFNYVFFDTDAVDKVRMIENYYELGFDIENVPRVEKTTDFDNLAIMVKEMLEAEGEGIR